MDLERSSRQRRFVVIAVLEAGWLAFLVWLAGMPAGSW
jgi:hypothetical protein